MVDYVETAEIAKLTLVIELHNGCVSIWNLTDMSFGHPSHCRENLDNTNPTYCQDICVFRSSLNFGGEEALGNFRKFCTTSEMFYRTSSDFAQHQKIFCATSEILRYIRRLCATPEILHHLTKLHHDIRPNEI